MKNYKFIQNPTLMAKIQNRKIYTNYLIINNIEKISKDNTPKKDGDLRDSIIKKSNSIIGGMIKWDVPYASYQERGMRSDGSHIIKNYTTPGTGPDFAKRAVMKSMEKLNDFFAESIRNIK